MTPDLNGGLPSLLLRVAGQVAQLDPGGRANMRRMSVETGCADLWRILATVGVEGDHVPWARFARIVALLTPNAETAEQRQVHSAQERLGRVLFEGRLSEARLNRLCSAPLPQRREQLERILRGLPTPNGVDLIPIGLLLFSEAPDTVRRVARDYFTAEVSANAKEDAE
jgi:hypothetical protein